MAEARSHGARYKRPSHGSGPRWVSRLTTTGGRSLPKWVLAKATVARIVGGDRGVGRCRDLYTTDSETIRVLLRLQRGSMGEHSTDAGVVRCCRPCPIKKTSVRWFR